MKKPRRSPPPPGLLERLGDVLARAIAVRCARDHSTGGRYVQIDFAEDRSSSAVELQLLLWDARARTFRRQVAQNATATKGKPSNKNKK